MENNHQINSIKLGKLQVSSKSTILVLILSIFVLIGFCIFCFTSCTRDITVQYIKSKNQYNQLNK